MTKQLLRSVALLLWIFGAHPDPASCQTPDGATSTGLPGLGVETVPDGEAQLIGDFQADYLVDMSRHQRTSAPTKRGQHPKSHSFLVARFTVADGLADDLRVGLLREPRSYTAVVRFSNTEAGDDQSPDVHGMAIKVLGVSGKKLLDEELDAETQDFVLIDHPLFFAKDVASTFATEKAGDALLGDQALLGRLHGMSVEKQQREELLNALSPIRPSEAGIIQMRRTLRSSLLATEFFSTTPYKLGASAVKYSAQPKPPLVAVQTKMNSTDYLKAAMVEQLTTLKKPALFGFYVQRQTDPRAMPIEDPTVKWMSPWEEVAMIEIPAQDFAFPARESWGNALSYTPWHSLPDHRPLGGINRARKSIYTASSKLRHANLSAPRKEPVDAEIPLQSIAP